MSFIHQQLRQLNRDWFNSMVHHARAAIKASQEYERRKPGIVEHLKRRWRIDFTLRQATDENWTLNDLVAIWSWHERQAKLYSANLVGLNAYLANRNLLAIEEGDPDEGNHQGG